MIQCSEPELARRAWFTVFELKLENETNKDIRLSHYFKIVSWLCKCCNSSTVIGAEHTRHRSEFRRLRSNVLAGKIDPDLISGSMYAPRIVQMKNGIQGKFSRRNNSRHNDGIKRQLLYRKFAKAKAKTKHAY